MRFVCDVTNVDEMEFKERKHISDALGIASLFARKLNVVASKTYCVRVSGMSTITYTRIENEIGSYNM